MLPGEVTAPRETILYAIVHPFTQCKPMVETLILFDQMECSQATQGFCQLRTVL